ncbi:hypothetical protein BDA96_06G137600 [Sorghum bicolor]|uniref:50S ribosomal protein L14, chloroplastic n=1 Tax=Sorghum bicolor TaxID=4558 RepID=A0A921QTI1_SORBI|nr:hypothetical protein BDA96_06G137600 [Sorghum bicolor]
MSSHRMAVTKLQVADLRPEVAAPAYCTSYGRMGMSRRQGRSLDQVRKRHCGHWRGCILATRRRRVWSFGFKICRRISGYMIQPQTLLNVADNSGAKRRKLMCIRVIGAAGNQRYSRISDVIIAVIKDVVPKMPLERSKVIRAVIVCTRDDGIIICYDDNATVIIDQKGNSQGTRVFGAVAKELRELNFTKIVSLACEVS